MSDAKSTPKELPILDQMRIEKELDEVVHRQRLTPRPIDFSTIPRQLFEPLIGCGICTKPIKKTLICQKCLARYCSTCISKAKFRNKDNYKCQKCHVLFDNKIKLVQDKTFDIIVEMIENHCPEKRFIYPIDEVMDDDYNMKKCNLYERDKNNISNNTSTISEKLNFLSFKGDYSNNHPLVKEEFIEENSNAEINYEYESHPVINNSVTSNNLNNLCNINKNGKSIYNLTNNNSLVIPYLRQEDLLCSSFESSTRSGRMLNIRLSPDINIINCFDRLGEIVRIPLYLKVSPNFKVKEFKKWALNRISELFEKQGVSSIKLGDENIDLYWSEFKPVILNVPQSPDNISSGSLSKKPKLELTITNNLPQLTQQISTTKLSKRDTIINTLGEEMTIDIFIKTYMEEQYKMNLFVDIFFKFRTQSSNEYSIITNLY
ncbi:Zinc finger, RING/FYVE/PHD-type domain-containing protein [Strongyloides ratti]|uniref:Zinc finger, RING/FYVE/PHD-type domain-containing protein n=1 Tax=Strongyloides ratti TaxID=34506 RepID=A0A090LUX4_STRRB|nr:Zinc finger, RING/FYVE/PHD-type domain-containing protein [Strongyloides ratti]CEF71444.1 Zinc finger, RING/FYVE/PHD-type domain-containing protein [Strongyloides ratti]